MADYTAFEAVLASAIPQVFESRFPEGEFTRAVRVTDDAAEDFVVTRAQVLISPEALSGSINVLDFCTRIALECHEFDTRAELEGQRILEEFNCKMQRAFFEIERRFGRDTLEQLIQANLNGGPHDPDNH